MLRIDSRDILMDFWYFGDLFVGTSETWQFC